MWRVIYNVIKWNTKRFMDGVVGGSIDGGYKGKEGQGKQYSGTDRI
jgi:hypothetical protein